MINVSLLTDELLEAGLPLVSLNSDGRFDYSRALTPAEQQTAATVIAAHDPAKRTRGEATALDQAKVAAANLKLYLDLPNPTGAQTVTTLKLLIRVVLWLLRNEFRT